MKELYCLKCQKFTPNVKPVIVKLPSGRYSARAKCKDCGSQKMQFVKAPLKGGNPLAIGDAIKGGIEGIASGIDKGVRAQHDFNKENGKLAMEKENNFMTYYRDLEHKRFWEESKLPSFLRLSKFGIAERDDTRVGSKWLKIPANRDKLDKADDALREWAEKRFYK